MRCAAIHAHFYQPPRENPWLGVVEPEPDAGTHADWNQRITAECYAPNADAPLLDAAGAIRARSNNYARISFNVGPTLAAWLERNAPAVWRAIVEGDRAHVRRGDRGAVLAQPYAHPILPLCTRREKRLQLLWGFQDFEHRFGRRPEGVWLPETAVDEETLAAAADLGFRFTILSPHQARRWRGPGAAAWSRVGPGGVDSRRAYRQALPGGRFIDLVFYDRAISGAVAFDGLLRSGKDLAARLGRRLEGRGTEPRIALVATDGETYGHHHRFGEMALAAALEDLARDRAASLATPAAFLAAHPPRRAVEVAPRTSWSCPHGVERWRADCGCRLGPAPAGGPGQAWRAPLREALERLRDRVEEVLAARGREVLADPDAAAEAYGRVVADGRAEPMASFLAEQLRRPDDGAARRAAAALMEMQRHALLMFASCGWFFDDLDRPEPLLVLRHATRAAELADASGGGGVEAALVRDLARVPGSSAEAPDGAALWRLRVVPARERAPRGRVPEPASGR